MQDPVQDDDKRFDLVVLGAGSGGVRAARFAAGYGARVAIVESTHFGGTCVHAGCVPKKLLVYGSEYASSLDDARGFGWDVEVRGHSWSALRGAKDRELARLGAAYRDTLDRAGVTIVEGRGRLESPHRLVVGDRVLEGERILIATGGHALRLDVPGKELGITSDEAFHLPELPRSIAILGSGYIAVEFAGIFRGLGVDVHLVHRGPSLLTRFDADVRAHLSTELQKRGIQLHLERRVVAIERAARGLRLVIEGAPSLEVDAVMHCVGRAPNARDLGLEAIGVELGARGEVPVDDAFRTRIPSVLAIGDVIDRVQLTPVALAEGTWVARHYYGRTDPPPLDYRLVPTAVFSQPNVATVGLTEAEARREHDVAIYRTTFRSMRHTITGRDERMLMKLVVDRASDRVLGVHVVGPEAGEIVQGFATALVCGVTKAQLDSTIGIHPTAAEELVTMRTPV